MTNEYDTMQSVGNPRSLGTDPFAELKESRALFEDLSSQFMAEAWRSEESLAATWEAQVLRRRAAMRLVPSPKMGFEHLHRLPECISLPDPQ